MKKEYKKPNIFNIQLNTFDIIVTSGGMNDETAVPIGIDDEIPGGNEWSLDF